jgi:F420-non-reducing hydrogenase iron-sulfur subunit
LIAKRRVNYTKKLLEEIGVEPERIRMVNIGAADARPFAEAMRDIVETIRKLGPAKLRKEVGAKL